MQGWNFFWTLSFSVTVLLHQRNGSGRLLWCQGDKNCVCYAKKLRLFFSRPLNFAKKNPCISASFNVVPGKWKPQIYRKTVLMMAISYYQGFFFHLSITKIQVSFQEKAFQLSQNFSSIIRFRKKTRFNSNICQTEKSMIRSLYGNGILFD